MSICDRCIHGEVCGLEDNHEEAIVYCKNMIPINVFDKIKGYIDHIRNTGMGKKKSLEFIEKYIDGLKAETE